MGTSVFVADPLLHPVLIAGLGALHTDSASFSRSLRKELGFEARRKGWQETADSSQADWTLHLQLLGYSPGGSQPFQGRALWSHRQGEIHSVPIEYAGLSGTAEPDPLPGDIRGVADWLMRQGLRKSRSKPDLQEYKPEMWMVF